MSLGRRPTGIEPSGPPSVPRGAGGPVPSDAPLTAQTGAGDADLWQHYTLQPTDVQNLAASTTPTGLLRPGSDFTLIIIEVYDVVTVLAGLNGSPLAGGYDLRHPGNGLLRFVVPQSHALGLASTAALINPIDVYLMAGAYATRQ